jgi:hypothetical protein
MQEEEKGLIRHLNGGWKKRELVPLPNIIEGVREPVVDLGGIWKHGRAVLEETFGCDKSAWVGLDIPCDIANAPNAADTKRRKKTGVLVSEGTTGLDAWVEADTEKNEEFVYTRKVKIPADFSGKRIYLRFDGVNYFSRVFVDSVLVGEHAGGFTSWNCDITDFVTPGRESELTIGTKDAPGRLNPDNQGGIIRPLKLVAVNRECRLSSLHYVTEFGADYKDAVLRLTIGVKCEPGLKAKILLTLVSPNGKETALETGKIDIGAEKTEYIVENRVSDPEKWDAEHPRLYTLRADLVAGGKVIESVSSKIGFRQIEVDGQLLKVNGRPVKLRGICRHDMSPHKGRAVSAEEIRRDIELFKEANINFVRTTNYPPREELLELCDELGMYVQEEAPVAYVGQRIVTCNNDPTYADEFVGQFAEMLERDKSHPCVLIWGLGNESNWGLNFRYERDCARKEDPTRPLSFSYAMTCSDERDQPDIWSAHYVSWDMDLSIKHDHMIIGHTNGRDTSPGYMVGYARGNDKPVLHDEMAHVTCYDRDAVMRDPGSRDFWGESIKRFWDGIWDTHGALGGAIWSGVDDVSCYGGGDKLNEWGILDVWRRPKPEYWLTKKAYSPIRIAETEAKVPKDGVLRLHIRNRFNHTDLSELKIGYRLGGAGGRVEGAKLPAATDGVLELPALSYKKGDALELTFTDAWGRLVEDWKIDIEPEAAEMPAPCGKAPELKDCGGAYAVCGKNFKIEFSKKDGLIREASYNGETLLCGGPYMNMVGFQMPEWQLFEMGTKVDDRVHILLKGGYRRIADVSFDVAVDAQGLITTAYRIDRKYAHMPRTVKIRVGMDPGGLDELGVYFVMPESVGRLDWKRRALWKNYPGDHIGRPEGTALRSFGEPPAGPNERPEEPWAHSLTNPALFGRYDLDIHGSNDFRSMKHNILCAKAFASDRAGVAVLSDGRDSVRLELAPNAQDVIDDRDGCIRYTGTWYAVDDRSGSFMNTEMYSEEKGAAAEIEFEGTGIVWYGSHDVIGGLAKVYVDGELKDDYISHVAEEAEKPGTSRGYERRYRRLQYAVDGLAYGKHTLRVEATGEKEPQADYAVVMIDFFRVLGTGRAGNVKLIVNNDYNCTRLAWGNYMRPQVRFDEGYANEVHIRLTDGQACCGKER